MKETTNSNTTLSRNQMHEKLMVCTYQYLFYLSLNEKQELSDIVESVFEMPISQCDPFVKKCLYQVITKLPEAVIAIQPLLNEWSFDRLGFIEQAILVLGYIEKKYMEMPKPVVINIAIKLAHKFAKEDSHKFINAVLEKI